MALAVSWYTFGAVVTVRALEWFIAISMCILAVQKLQDIESFSTMFLNYDLLARRWVRYGYLSPFGQALTGILMLAGALLWIASPVALFLGTPGAVSVFTAAHLAHRERQCALAGRRRNETL